MYKGNISSRQHIASFIVVGDTQRTSFWEFWRERNNKFRINVLKKIALENPAFVIHLGDHIFQGSSKNQWRKFDEDCSELKKNSIPLIPVLGNHDLSGNKKRALSNYFSRFPYLNHRKWLAFRYRTMGIILLNSNFRQQSEIELQQQNIWYQSSLEKFRHDPAISSIIVACHHPPYTNSTIIRDSLNVQSSFVESFITETKTKLFLSGHCHSYEHFIQDQKHFVVSGGGGGPRHILKIDTDKQRHIDVYSGIALRPFHYCRISDHTYNLNVKMIFWDTNANQWSVGEDFNVD